MENSAAVQQLQAFLAGGQVLALTGAGCSTPSGIPDYRSPGRRPRASIQDGEFRADARVRQRYWARSYVGWPRMAAAEPNIVHRSLAQLEREGQLCGVVTQNVDGLHGRAGSQQVVELHGRIGQVRCLDCGYKLDRRQFQTMLAAANSGFADGVGAGQVAPDGDFELPESLVAGFRVPPCPRCSGGQGRLAPDVVLFGAGVEPKVREAGDRLRAGCRALLVLGTSLAVFSAYRHLHWAARHGRPILIVNRGPTRGAERAGTHLECELADLFAALQAIGPSRALV